MTPSRLLSLAALSAAVSLSLSACRDEPPPPYFAQDLGDDNRPLPPLPDPSVTLPEKLVTGKADLTPLDLKAKSGASADAADKTGAKEGEPASPAAPPMPPMKVTSAEFPETTTAVQKLIADYNKAAATGDVNALGDFYVEDQRADMIKALTAAKGAVEKIAALRSALKEKAPEAAAKFGGHLAMMGSPETALLMHLATLTPESETKATGTLGPMYGGEAVRFRRIQDTWFIDPDAAKILADMQASSAMFQPLEDITAGLNSGSMDGPTAIDKLTKWMASVIGGGAAPEEAPKNSPAPEHPSGPGGG